MIYCAVFLFLGGGVRVNDSRTSWRGVFLSFVGGGVWLVYVCI